MFEVTSVNRAASLQVEMEEEGRGGGEGEEGEGRAGRESKGKWAP